MRIRLRRLGGKHRYMYQIVVVDSRTGPSSSKCIANIGYYHPTMKEGQLYINKEKVKEWLQKGAQLSSTVKALIKRAGVRKTLESEKMKRVGD